MMHPTDPKIIQRYLKDKRADEEFKKMFSFLRRGEWHYVDDVYRAYIELSQTKDLSKRKFMREFRRHFPVSRTHTKYDKGEYRSMFFY